MLRRMGIIAVLSLIVVAFAAVPAFAEPMITNVQPDASGNLTVTFTEALPAELANQQIVYVLLGSADTTYFCLKKNGRPPKGGAVFAGTVPGAAVQDTGIFLAEPVVDPSDPTGTTMIGADVSGSLTLSPPLPTGLSCPKGLRLFPTSVTYTDLALRNMTTLSPAVSIVGTFGPYPIAL